MSAAQEEIHVGASILAARPRLAAPSNCSPSAISAGPERPRQTGADSRTWAGLEEAGGGRRRHAGKAETITDRRRLAEIGGADGNTDEIRGKCLKNGRLDVLSTRTGPETETPPARSVLGKRI